MLLTSKKHNGFCVDVALNHIHNHAMDVADALRFRPMSENTKDKYYDLFRQGHSPASAHLEHETNLTYSDDPQMLAGSQKLVMCTTCLTSGGSAI